MRYEGRGAGWAGCMKIVSIEGNWGAQMVTASSRRTSRVRSADRRMLWIVQADFPLPPLYSLPLVTEAALREPASPSFAKRYLGTEDGARREQLVAEWPLP